MRSKSIGKNYIFNLILTTVNIIFPLITAPYLSKILGAENIGKVNYATSIINWFILFAAFGIPRYGLREIARNRDSKSKLSNSFWNLLLIQFIFSIISFVVYLIIILNINSFESEIYLYISMLTMIILSIFSIDWFYQGIEEYGYITIRNIVVKVISIIMIFFMIKNKEDYVVYALINIFGLGFNNVLNYMHTKKYIEKKIIKFELIRYIKELRVYFLTTLVVAMYTQLDQTFIGTLSEKDLAFYIRSKTIQGIGFNLTNSAITILIPRVSYLAVKDYNKYKEMIRQSIKYIYILAIPSMFGIIILAKEIMYVLGGEEFLEATGALQIMSVIIVIISIGGWQVNQILIPNKKEKNAFYFQCVACVFSIVANIVIIPRFSYIGATIVWLLTESLLLILVAIYIKKNFNGLKIRYIDSEIVKYFISAMGMSISIILLKLLIVNPILVLIIAVPIGAVVYFVFNIALKDKLSIGIFKAILNKLKTVIQVNDKT